MVDGVGGLHPHDRFGMIGDADSRLREHGQVVGPISRCDDALRRETMVLAHELEGMSLGFTVDHLTLDPAGELSIAYFQLVGHGVIEAELLLQAVGEV